MKLCNTIFLIKIRDNSLKKKIIKVFYVTPSISLLISRGIDPTILGLPSWLLVNHQCLGMSKYDRQNDLTSTTKEILTHKHAICGVYMYIMHKNE